MTANCESSSVLRVFSRALDLFDHAATLPPADCADDETPAPDPSIPSYQLSLPSDLVSLLLEMRTFCQDREFVTSGLLIPSELHQSNSAFQGFRGGGPGEVRSECISRRHADMCFRETISVEGRHFPPGCVMAVGQIILDLPEISTFEGSLTGVSSWGDEGGAPFASDSFASYAVSDEVNLDGLIDFEDFLEQLALEVERWDASVKKLSQSCFGKVAVPAETLNAVSRDISRPSTEQGGAREPELTIGDDDDDETSVSSIPTGPVFTNAVLFAFGKVKSLLNAFILHDDGRTGCVPVDVFSQVCRNGGGGSWPAWGIPPLYAHTLRTMPPPGTPGSTLGANPLKEVRAARNGSAPLKFN